MTGYLGLLLEELFEESAKTDFKDKFGEQTFQNFEKAKQRLKNNNMSVDYGQYLKMDKEDVDNLILSLYDDKKDAQRKRMIKGEDKEIRGKYNYLGEKGGYKIYQPLDVQASMDLGVNTGWCTTGRYGHYGHPEFTPSEEDAASHFNEYTKDNGIKLYYFLNPQTMYGEYAVAVYPKTLYPVIHINGIYVNSTNFELFDAKDQLDYSAITKLPLDVIPNIDISAYKLDIVVGYPESLELLSIEEARELPKSAMRYEASWWLRSPGYISYKAAYTNLGGGIVDVGNNVFYGSRAVCPSLKISNPKPSNLELYKKYNVNNEFIGVYIGDNKFLYKGEVIRHRFDEKSNNYETSEIKQFLNNWLKELQSKSKDMKESLNRRNNKMTLNEYKRTRKKNLTESFEKGSFVVVDNHYPDCEYQKSFSGSMIVCCTYKVIDDLGDKLLCRDPRRRYRKGTTLGELIDKKDVLFSSNDLMEVQRFHSNFVKNFDYDKVKPAKVNERWAKPLKEDFWWEEEEGFFTRDDLDEFQAELEDEIPNVIFRKTYLEPGNSLEVDWEYEGYEETTKVRVDMRRIRYPRDLIRKYAPTVAGMIKNSCAEIDRELNESLRSRRYLKEDYDSLIDLAEEMINYLNKNGVSWVDLYTVNDDGPLSSITLEIDGDWKHDHLRANYLLKQKYGDRIKSIQDYSLEDTGSDWGKEAHVIRLK